MDPFTLSLMVSILTLAVTVAIAYWVWNHCHPIPREWSDFDYWPGRKPLMQHIVDCGLIYPCVYLYMWLAAKALIGFIKF